MTPARRDGRSLSWSHDGAAPHRLRLAWLPAEFREGGTAAQTDMDAPRVASGMLQFWLGGFIASLYPAFKVRHDCRGPRWLVARTGLIYLSLPEGPSL